MKQGKPVLYLVLFFLVTSFHLEAYGQRRADSQISARGYNMVFRDDFDAISGCNKSCYEGVLVAPEDINKIRTVTFEEVRQVEQEVLNQQNNGRNRGSQ